MIEKFAGTVLLVTQDEKLTTDMRHLGRTLAPIHSVKNPAELENIVKKSPGDNIKNILLVLIDPALGNLASIIKNTKSIFPDLPVVILLPLSLSDQWDHVLQQCYGSLVIPYETIDYKLADELIKVAYPNKCLI